MLVSLQGALVIDFIKYKQTPVKFIDSDYTCTREQFLNAQEDFRDYISKPNFREIYEKAIVKHCERKLINN